MKPLPEKSLDTFCQIYTDARGAADITCPADNYHVSCLAALERRGLILWDTERVGGKVKRWCALTPLGAKEGCEQLAVMPSGINGKRNRVCISMFLDLNNEDHYEAWTIANSLKGERIFTPVIVDLLRMHSEFLHSEDATFAEAYPAMYKLMTETRQADLIGKLETLLQNTRIPADNAPTRGLVQPQGLRAITGAKDVPMPIFDDDSDEDLLEVKKSIGHGKIVAENFLRSIGAFQQ